MDSNHTSMDPNRTAMNSNHMVRNSNRMAEISNHTAMRPPNYMVGNYNNMTRNTSNHMVRSPPNYMTRNTSNYIVVDIVVNSDHIAISSNRNMAVSSNHMAMGSNRTVMVMNSNDMPDNMIVNSNNMGMNPNNMVMNPRNTVMNPNSVVVNPESMVINSNENRSNMIMSSDNMAINQRNMAMNSNENWRNMAVNPDGNQSNVAMSSNENRSNVAMYSDENRSNIVMSSDNIALNPRSITTNSNGNLSNTAMNHNNITMNPNNMVTNNYQPSPSERLNPTQDNHPKMRSVEQELDIDTLTKIIDFLDSKITSLVKARDEKSEWLHTIPPGKSYAPAFYLYLCRSFPIDPPNPSSGWPPLPDPTMVGRTMVQAAVDFVAEKDAEISNRRFQKQQYEEMLNHARGLKEMELKWKERMEEGIEQREGMGHFRIEQENAEFKEQEVGELSGYRTVMGSAIPNHWSNEEDNQQPMFGEVPNENFQQSAAEEAPPFSWTDFMNESF